MNWLWHVTGQGATLCRVHSNMVFYLNLIFSYYDVETIVAILQLRKSGLKILLFQGHMPVHSGRGKVQTQICLKIDNSYFYCSVHRGLGLNTYQSTAF